MDNNQNEFGDFDLSRQLTEYEMSNFDSFMKPSNTSINAAEVSITESVEENIEHLDEYLDGHFE